MVASLGGTRRTACYPGHAQTVVITGASAGIGRAAVAVAVPRASRAITTAGLALAAGFGLLALVPLVQFREIALAMVLGIVIDTFIVRSLLWRMLVVSGSPVW